MQAGEDDLRHVRANSLMAQTLAVYLGNGHMRPLPPPGPVRMRRHPGSEGFPEQEERPNVAAGVEPQFRSYTRYHARVCMRTREAMYRERIADQWAGVPRKVPAKNRQRPCDAIALTKPRTAVFLIAVRIDNGIPGRWQDEILNRQKKPIQTGFGDGFPDVNTTIVRPAGHLILTRAVFGELELGPLLNGMKRDQGVQMYDAAVALVVHQLRMQGLSINRMMDILESTDAFEEYGIPPDCDINSLYRAADRLGEHADEIIRHINAVYRDKFGVKMEGLFMDWSASYLDGQSGGMYRFGYSKDHRPDRPQINYGMVMNGANKLLQGLTVVPGNTNDVTHFMESYEQVRPFMQPGCLIIFDNGGYSAENAKKVVADGFHFLTRSKHNGSDDRIMRIPESEWTDLGDGVRAYAYKGNKGYRKVMYFSKKRYDELMESYKAKAERDYEEAVQLRAMVQKGKPRKKYVNSNSFLKTTVGYTFSLSLMEDREHAIEEAVKSRITGREGYFILTSSKDMDMKDMLEKYRSRNAIEDAFRDLKHGIDLRPMRCKKPEAAKGRVLIAYLALTVLYFTKFIAPELKHMRAETLVGELTSLSVIVTKDEKGVKHREYGNFTPVICTIIRGFRTIRSRFGWDRGRKRLRADTSPPSPA